MSLQHNYCAYSDVTHLGGLDDATKLSSTGVILLEPILSAGNPVTDISIREEFSAKHEVA